MPKRLNLAKQIEKQLPAELVNLMWMAGEIAHTRGEKLYLVGGVVRDLMLGKPNLDLDLVVEGNAIELAQRLKKNVDGKLTTHARFNTAKLEFGEWSVDLATARTETYEKPGALPTVTPGAHIDNDLGRRDFTINAMALGLNPGTYGQPIDPHGGREDLKNELIRVLHDKSFIDDATRIWRGLRYEQRLDFHMEKKTLGLLRRDIDMLKTISADRTRYEIECILKEPYPEKVFRRAALLGVLATLHPGLRGDGWLLEKFEQARKLSKPEPPEPGLYLALLAYPLTKEETESFISRLKLPKALAQVLLDSSALKGKMRLLSTPGLSPSGIFRLLEPFSTTAMLVNSIATESPAASQNVHLYLTRLKDVEIALRGDDLIKMGITTGPEIRQVMELLQKGRLDGEISSKEEEVNFVRGWAAKK